MIQKLTCILKFEMQTFKNPDSCFGISVLKTDWTQSKFTFCKWGPVRFLWSKTTSLSTRSSDSHSGRVSLWVGCTALWTSCSAFDFFVFATNSRMNVKDLKSWIILFPKSSFIYLPVIELGHMANQMLPGTMRKPPAAQRAWGFPCCTPEAVPCDTKEQPCSSAAWWDALSPYRVQVERHEGQVPLGTCTLSDTTIMIKNSQVVTF